MGVLIDAYRQVASKVNEINANIQNIEAEIKKKTKDNSGSRKARIIKLQEQLEKIDDYLLRIRGFQELAKKNLDSQNILTIEAPPGYRVNLNRLRNWAMMIDPMSSNDPYAQRVYIVAKCDECFLEKKKKEFTDRIDALNADQSLALNEEIESLKESLSALQEELKQYSQSPEVSDFVSKVLEENKKYWYETSPAEYHNMKSTEEYIAPGAITFPLDFAREQRVWLKSLLGDCFDVETGNVYLPAEIKCSSEYVMSISCVPSRRKYLDRAIQNFILEGLNSVPAGYRKFYILDGLRFNSASLGGLRQLEGSFLMEQIPRNPEQMTSTLEYLVSSFSDTDEIIEQFDSVAEYNHAVEKNKRLPLRTMFLFGWPHAFEGRDRELLLRIMRNYERYGISFVTISYKASDAREEVGNAMPEYAYQNAIRINVTQSEAKIIYPETEPQNFVWYTFADQISPDYIRSMLEQKVKNEVLGNEYLKRYSLTDVPQYTREYKKLEVPFGIDGKDQAHSVSFENENFATYLVGASRSGKSTLIHTLIAGLIRNYHPDNVELWLADFKQLEFKRYITHLPPHVKYVLLDESSELVYDLIDRLTAEMMERQKLFAKLAVQRIDQVNPMLLEKPLPVIFVILDEFSIMSQAISDSDVYKLRLQNILAKGAALGIKFLFSSQTFTTGVSGLTPTARAQIQQRIAMKGTSTEIGETLELSSSLKTEQVKNWMDALPPHYALVKFKMSADTLPVVKRYLVMYFKDYEPRDRMIAQINRQMRAIEGYNPADITAYTDKQPVTVDGNTFEAFPKIAFSEYMEKKRQEKSEEMSEDEKFVIFGSPRLMERMKVAAFSEETRENVLLLSRTAEQACTASILLSIMKSFILQNGFVEIWAYSKNTLFKTYRQNFEQYGIKIVEGMDDVCDAIYDLKQSMKSNTLKSRLIVLIGMERLCVDFDYLDAVQAKSVPSDFEKMRQGFIQSGAVVQTEEEERMSKFVIKKIILSNKLENELKEQGKSKEEIDTAIKEAIQNLEVEMGIIQMLQNAQETQDFGANTEEVKHVEEVKEEGEPEHEKGAYHALEDFGYVVKHGSRMGCHFVMTLNNLTDLKQCGLKSEFFRYKMTFQLSLDDSRSFLGNASATKIPEHICQYDDGLTKYSFRPYLHKGIGWEGWQVNEDGIVINPFE